MKNRKIKKKNLNKIIATLLASGIVFSMITPYSTYAEELSTYDQNRMLGATAMDWHSTNLREWLNSDKEVVDYTALKPSYANEPGFLSNNNFTQAERDGIAVTRHGAGLQSSLNGNTSQTLYFSKRSVSHNDYQFNDKVFILHFTDIENYIEKNKELMNLNKKYYSNYLQKVTNKKDKYDYVVNSGYYNYGYINVSVLYTSTLAQVNTRSPQNIVPALSLKPNYRLANGTYAKDLVVGSTVTFGKYNEEAIEWQVINKTDDGYPLLWSTRILTTKEYDKEGDINPNKSSYINYDNHDINIVPGNGQAKSWETKGSIDSMPVINILNQEVLTTPTNETSMVLKIKATDSKYGIRKMTLPDGTIINGDYVEWTLKDNGEYDIIAENSIGVISVKHIVTKAINTPAEVTITTDKNNNSKWSNRPVNVTVSATNNGVYTKEIKANRNMGYYGLSTTAFPSWMSLGGKRLRVTGTVKNAMSDEDASKVDMNAYIRMRLNYKWYNNSQTGDTYPIIKQIQLNELKSKGEINIDEIFIIPDNVYGNASMSINLMDNNTMYLKNPYNYWLSDFTYEILDKDDLKIEQIFLPDGNVVNSDKVTYTISKNGSYTFSAKDNRDKITSKTIELAIDTVKPNLDITMTPTTFTKSGVLKIVGTDDLSGIKQIKLPNGEYRVTTAEGQSLSIDYNVNTNGNYTFEAEDYAGNKFTKTISVTNIDTVPPTANISISPNTWTSSKVNISVEAQDNGGSGVKEIKLPNGTIVNGSNANYEVSTNGNYSFDILDKLGNKLTKTVTVSNIDVIPPTLSLSKPNTWSNETISINVTAGDKESGLKQIVLPNGSSINVSSTTFVVSEVGVYYFKAIDNAGNETVSYIVVDNIDKIKPSVKIENNQNWNNSTGVQVSISGADN